MQKQQEILSGIDAAIDRMDMRGIDSGLAELASTQSEPILAEDPALFAANIMKLSEEKRTMKLRSKPAKILIAAALVAVLGVTAYAASALHLFAFQSGESYFTIQTNDPGMSEEEAKEMAEAAQKEIDRQELEAAGATVEAPRVETFASVEEAESALGIEVVMPDALPAMTFDGATGQTYYYGDNGAMESRNAWINYSDDAGRMFGITIDRTVITSGEPVTALTQHEIDEGSLGSYTSKSGVEYTTLSESSSEDSSMVAHIATANRGEYEYTLVFVGFDEAEREVIIDSADLSVYAE